MKLLKICKNTENKTGMNSSFLLAIVFKPGYNDRDFKYRRKKNEHTKASELYEKGCR